MKIGYLVSISLKIDILQERYDMSVCGDDYLGETQQPLAKQAHQHTHPAAGRPNSAVLDHTGDTEHRVYLDSFEREDWRRQELGRQSGSDS